MVVVLPGSVCACEQGLCEESGGYSWIDSGRGFLNKRVMMQAMSEELDKLIHSIPCLWKGNRRVEAAADVLSTGYETLDRLLPGGGWPSGVVMEFLPETAGIGELSLMLPAMKALMQAQRHVLMIGTPHLPYAPALSAAGLDLGLLLLIRPDNPVDALWAAEKALLNPACGMVLLWSGSHRKNNPLVFDNTVIRRLQVAAQQTQSILVLYRAGCGSPVQNPWAAVRLALSRQGGQMVIDVLKARGSGRQPRLRIDLQTV